MSTLIISYYKYFSMIFHATLFKTTLNVYQFLLTEGFHLDFINQTQHITTTINFPRLTTFEPHVFCYMHRYK